MTQAFFQREPQDLAVALIGKVLRHKYVDPCYGPLWLAAQIIETEAYYLTDRASHSSLGFTEKRRALFMTAGTLYMYYARGKDSLNFSALGDGNGVLIKSGYPYLDQMSPAITRSVMQTLNPGPRGLKPVSQLCSGQTLLCRALNIKVAEWNAKALTPSRIRLDDVGYKPASVVQCRRLGITEGRDEHLLYRFVDGAHVRHCTRNPLTKRGAEEGIDYLLRRP